MLRVNTQHIMIDLGTGNNNKINWAIHDKQEVIDIIETVYRGARWFNLVERCRTRTSQQTSLVLTAHASSESLKGR
eukprot:734297-Pleurochrysis_carterae.AAC.11